MCIHITHSSVRRVYGWGIIRLPYTFSLHGIVWSYCCRCVSILSVFPPGLKQCRGGGGGSSKRTYSEPCIETAANMSLSLGEGFPFPPFKEILLHIHVLLAVYKRSVSLLCCVWLCYISLSVCALCSCTVHARSSAENSAGGHRVYLSHGERDHSHNEVIITGFSP